VVAIRALGEDFRMAQNGQERQKLSFQCESSTTEQIVQLARRGDRSISAEIRRALREHVANEAPGVLPPLRPGPVQRSESSQLRRQSNSPLLSGPKEAA
jgi:hypothetical protein